MKKPRFSLGSIVMLLATLFVVIGMAAFLTLIAGDGVYERTRTVFGLLALLGVVNDPTTTGVSDSTQALTYQNPKKNYVELTKK